MVEPAAYGAAVSIHAGANGRYSQRGRLAIVSQGISKQRRSPAVTTFAFRDFIIPSQDLAVFEVRFYTEHFIQGAGNLELDFSSGDFQVMCPALVMAILS